MLLNNLGTNIITYTETQIYFYRCLKLQKLSVQWNMNECLITCFFSRYTFSTLVYVCMYV